MKNKLLLLTAVAITSSASMQAQVKNLNPGGIYIKVGLSLSNISVNTNGTVNDAKTLTTFHAGIVGDIPLLPILSLQAGLSLNGKGAKSEYYADNNNKNDNYIKAKFNPLYLELPVNLVLKFPIGDNSRFFIGAGPYAAIGIGGKTKTDVKILGVSSSSDENITFNNDNPTTSQQEDASFTRVRKFDYGVNALAGIETGKLLLGVNYGLGLTKINSNGDNNSNDKNKYRVFSVSVGFKL